MRSSPFSPRNLVYCALSAGLMALCAWIAVPFGPIRFTLQTFGLFLCLALLGGRRGAVSCLVYLAMGGIGLPVFSGFQGGVGALFGLTGGYLWGFFLASLAYWGICALLGVRGMLPGLLLGLAVCYACGAGWYALQAPLPFSRLMAVCVAPYVLPDLAGIALALLLRRRLKRFIP